MNKQEFINRLRWFAANKGVGLKDEYDHPDYAPSRGEAVLAGLFARWLDEQDIPESSCQNWAHDIPKLLVEAHADLATDAKWAEARSAYRRIAGHELPDLVDAHAGGLHRTLVAHSAARLMPLLAEEPWLRHRIEEITEAQQTVINLAWWRFVRVSYRKLMPRIKTERHRGNIGTFGATTLMTWACAGRVMFIFERPSGQMTYVADDSDMYGLRAGPNAPGAPYAECVAMIEEVIEHWDVDKMQRSDTVGPG